MTFSTWYRRLIHGGSKGELGAKLKEKQCYNEYKISPGTHLIIIIDIAIIIDAIIDVVLFLLLGLLLLLLL